MPKEIPPTWLSLIEDQKITLSNIAKILIDEYRRYDIYPSPNDVFRAFDFCTPEQIKVVIIGQDPYHTPDIANGLAFAVNKEYQMPPSLVNIFNEVKRDYKECPNNPTLEGWANQGVLLLNSILTVRRGMPNSHKNIGWQKITSSIVNKLSKKGNIVFLLWGNNAKKMIPLIEENNHILITSHPSPLSARLGFLGCCHFTKTNKLLKNPINWEK